MENKDTGLCATCGAEDRKAARAALKPIKTYTIPKMSKQGKERDKKVKQTYKEMDAKTPHVCGGCGAPIAPNGSHSHLCPRSTYPEHRAAAWNIVYDCPTCHRIWEHGTWEAVKQLLDIDQRIKTLQKHCQQHLFRRFLLKDPKIALEIVKKY